MLVHSSIVYGNRGKFWTHEDVNRDRVRAIDAELVFFAPAQEKQILLIHT